MRILLPTLLLLLACNNRPAAEPAPAQQAPAVFEEKGDVVELVKSSRGKYESDVVASMFAEELERDTALAHLLERIDRISSVFPDSSEAFMRFDGNNGAFYASADGHAASLTDSTDRRVWMQRVTDSRTRLNLRVQPIRDQLTTFHALEREAGQLRKVVMLDRTLRTMEAYQSTAIPSDAPLTASIKELRALRDRLRSELPK
jgi:hypothetical protein